MSKKNLLISAALTTFVLVVLANMSAVYARMRNTVSPASQATAQPTAALAEALPIQNQATQVTHQEAAAIAAKFLGQNDLYSVENASWNGVDAYKVVFSSGTIVYVSLDGQILGSEAPQPVFVSAPAKNNHHNQSHPATVASHTEDHDNHEEQESHEEQGD